MWSPTTLPECCETCDKKKGNYCSEQSNYYAGKKCQWWVPLKPRKKCDVCKGAGKTVTVCAECLQASCWQGKFMCDKSRDADIKEIPVSELRRLRREHEDNWEEHDCPECVGKDKKCKECAAPASLKVIEGSVCTCCNLEKKVVVWFCGSCWNKMVEETEKLKKGSLKNGKSR